MGPFNDIWKYHIEEARPAGLKIDYLDVYPMSLQRGDSHLSPPNDCLHFCYQGVTEEWQQVSQECFVGHVVLLAKMRSEQFLWQEILRESLNGDYDIGNPTYL
jgi:hypothetical protein